MSLIFVSGFLIQLAFLCNRVLADVHGLMSDWSLPKIARLLTVESTVPVRSDAKWQTTDGIGRPTVSKRRSFP
jgi:hypothetical protein